MPRLTTAIRHRLVGDFGDMLTQQTGVLLPAWIKAPVEAVCLPRMPSALARGLHRDWPVVGLVARVGALA
ncbi:hypothetical protein [Streptomyces sp. NPDC059850]|uniref:hypothetical protein n=1 Tax=Streptomyces sp. NPDC059850 TaxID=3346970 RepID=UPI003667CC40